MDDRTTVGWREWVWLPALCPDEPIKAKIDTGARTSAIHAWDLEPDGEHRLAFSLHPRQRDDDHVVRTEADVVEWREVRSSNGDVERRPVILTELAIGDLRYEFELTLTQRDRMGFRMLLGRTAMAKRLAVDPGASFLLGRAPTRRTGENR